MNTPTSYPILMVEGRHYALVPVEELPQALIRRNEQGVRIPEADYSPWEVIRRHIEEDVSKAKAWREYLHLSQEEVAEKMDISQAALSKIERAKRPRHETLQRLAKALDISIEQLKS